MNANQNTSDKCQGYNTHNDHVDCPHNAKATRDFVHTVECGPDLSTPVCEDCHVLAIQTDIGVYGQTMPENCVPTSELQLGIKHIDCAPDLGGLSVCIHYTNYTKLHITIQPPTPVPLRAGDFLNAVEKALFLPKGYLSMRKVSNHFVNKFVNAMPDSENFTLTPVKKG